MNASERHGRHKVLNMLKTLAEWSPRYVIARRWLKDGRKKAEGLARAQIERIAVAQWTPCDLPVNRSDASASLVRPFWLLWTTNSVRWTFTVVNALLHSAIMSTFEPPWRRFCVTSASFERGCNSSACSDCPIYTGLAPSMFWLFRPQDYDIMPPRKSKRVAQKAKASPPEAEDHASTTSLACSGNSWIV